MIRIAQTRYISVSYIADIEYTPPGSAKFVTGISDEFPACLSLTLENKEKLSFDGDDAVRIWEAFQIEQPTEALPEAKKEQLVARAGRS